MSVYSGYGKASGTMQGLILGPLDIHIHPTSYLRELWADFVRHFRFPEDFLRKIDRSLLSNGRPSRQALAFMELARQIEDYLLLSKADTWEAGLLNLVFLNTDFTTLGDAGGLRGSVAAGSIYCGLHTADPGEAGAQNTNETSYTNYLRTGGGVARSGAGWTVSGSAPTQVANAAAINYATCGATGATLTHVGIGAASSAAGKLMYSGSLTSQLVVSSGITPSFAISALVVTED